MVAQPRFVGGFVHHAPDGAATLPDAERPFSSIGQIGERLSAQRLLRFGDHLTGERLKERDPAGENEALRPGPGRLSTEIEEPPGGFASLGPAEPPLRPPPPSSWFPCDGC